MGITAILQQIGAIVWGPPTWALLGACGLYLSVRTKGFQVTRFGHYCSQTVGKLFKKRDKSREGDLSPFQAFNTAMAATMGVGTLAGTATAIASGGPGAIFWMWLIGFLGITTKFAEITLAVHYRVKNERGMILGGPMQYILKGLEKRWKWLAIVFSVAGALAAFGLGNMVQSNNVASAMETAFNVPRPLTGVILVIFVGIVIIGGVKRVGKVAEKSIPASGIFMILLCLLVIFENITAVPNAFGLIFRGAFTFQGAVGGFLGAGVATAIRYGLMRGIFSNEAGLGSAPIAHAAAQAEHPCRQGLWGAFEVFIDTHVMCTLVAIAIIASGSWLFTDAQGAGLTAIPLFMATVSSSFLGEVAGNYISAIAILGFASTTMLGWAFYGEKCLEFLAGAKSNLPYRIIFLVPVFVGVFGVVPVWAISDILNAFMAIPNVVGVIALSGVFTAITKAYFKGERYVPYDEDKDFYKRKPAELQQ